jgi:putative ABC transport system permease protein
VLADKVVSINYLVMAPLLLGTLFITAILAGAYPSYLITRTTTLDALKDANNKGQRGGLFRSFMIGTQFTLSIFMLALVMIVLLQNQKVAESANIFPKDQVLVLERIGTQDIMEKEDILRRELMAIEHIEGVSFTSIAPFDQSNSSTTVSRVKGDENGLIPVNQLSVSHDFMSVLNVPVVAGRDFTTQDKRASLDVRVMNVILNELAARQLGFNSPQEAVGESLWGATPDEEDRDNFEYRVVGVVADRNYQGLHNEVKAFVHFQNLYPRQRGLVRISDSASVNVIEDIEAAWKRVFPTYPLEHRYMDALFQDVYQVYQAMSGTLAGFAIVAMLLALIGLFGLAAFMARGRTKEIGVRKVMGASVPQIVRLLLWQFSKPVMWALAVALPLTVPATSMYLNFFADRINLQIPLIILAGVVAISLACSVISVHAFRVAKASPISALRYE